MFNPDLYIERFKSAIDGGMTKAEIFLAAQFERIALRIDKIGAAIDALDTRGETVLTSLALEPNTSGIVLEDRRGYQVRIVNAWSKDGTVDLYRGQVTPSNYVGSTQAAGAGISCPITLPENQPFMVKNTSADTTVTVVVEATLIKTERYE